MTVALGTLSMSARFQLSQAIIADLETELAALPLPDDGYSDGGTPYTDAEITFMRQEVMQRFLDRQANLNLATRLFC